MPFNPDSNIYPEKTHPKENETVLSGWDVQIEALAALTASLKRHGFTASRHDLDVMMEAVSEHIAEQVKSDLSELNETYPDVSYIPEDWELRMNEAVKELAA